MPPITHLNNPLAHGEFDPVTQTITLLPGSILTINPGHDIVHPNIAGSYNAAIAAIQAGHIAPNAQGQLVIQNPIPGLNPSRAHVFATGTVGQAWYLWLLENGDPIDVYRQGNGPAPEPPPAPNPAPVPLVGPAGQAVAPDPAGQPPQVPPPLPPRWDGNLPEGIDQDCLSIYRFPPLPDYLRINRHRILALGAQALPPWNAGYNAFNQPVMQRLRYAFPEGRISRADVVALCESWHDPVLCLVAAMVWGGISTGGITGDNLTPLLAMGEPALRARMEALRGLICAGAFEKAFVDCSTPAALKFHGVGYAYFTKLFYFLGQVPPVLNPAPLILDKWTSNAFLVLGRQVCPSPEWQTWFDTDPLCSDKPAKWQMVPDGQMYRLYIAWFNHWACLLGTSAAQLEQFVFGWSLAGAGNVPHNPRNQLIALGKSFFCPPAP